MMPPPRNQDRNGQKSVGQFVELRLVAVEQPGARWPPVVLGLVAAFVVVIGGAFALDRLAKRTAA